MNSTSTTATIACKVFGRKDLYQVGIMDGNAEKEVVVVIMGKHNRGVFDSLGIEPVVMTRDELISHHLTAKTDLLYTFLTLGHCGEVFDHNGQKLHDVTY